MKQTLIQQNITLHNLQQFIKIKDNNPKRKNVYFQKLIEEVGELAVVLRKDKRLEDTGIIKGTIEEELYDVLYYVLAIANSHNIDMEECFRLKEQYKQEKKKK
ncbi:MazG nucleotide pyrophosphohydrolase domain-containing protein [Ectobacillus polymachus]|uniref:MazG nucleotide pyrophosphohydrolase domain-containing protein n=1 Tax=Ectobacillus polymachus TaxID=1508806 RepID=UPI003A838628